MNPSAPPMIAVLVKRMSSLNTIKEAKLVSFDIKDLYPSIPTAETMEILFKTLLSKTDETLAKEIVNTLKATINQNYFRFNNKIYRQTNGLGMGNPTSAILMEVFMQHLETQYMEHLKTNLGVTFYARYVDDIICIITGDKEEQILDYLNQQHTNITFTMEKEVEGKLNYLDLTVRINKATDQLEYEIYRKPTATDTVIHNTSNHPQQQKNAAFRQLITRLERIPLTKEAYKRELDTIYTIAENNGYKKNLVNKIKRDSRRKSTNNGENKETTWTVLTYTGKMSYKLAKIFRKYNIRTSFKTRSNVGKILNCCTNDEDPLDKQGVYKLTCECNCSYIGQTGRKIRTRFREHIRDYNKKILKPGSTPESNFANHMFENKCTPRKINKAAKLLHVQHKGQRLSVLENMEIYKQKTFEGKIINEQTSTASDVIFEPLRLLYGKNTTACKVEAVTKTQNKGTESNKKKITDFYLPENNQNQVPAK